MNIGNYTIKIKSEQTLLIYETNSKSYTYEIPKKYGILRLNELFQIGKYTLLYKNNNSHIIFYLFMEETNIYKSEGTYDILYSSDKYTIYTFSEIGLNKSYLYGFDIKDEKEFIIPINFEKNSYVKITDDILKITNFSTNVSEFNLITKILTTSNNEYFEPPNKIISSNETTNYFRNRSFGQLRQSTPEKYRDTDSRFSNDHHSLLSARTNYLRQNNNIYSNDNSGHNYYANEEEPRQSSEEETFNFW